MTAWFDTEVPCNGCTLCCRGTIVLHPAFGDDPTQYDTEVIDDLGVVLKRQSDGRCIYVTEKGCSIWPHTPAVCRVFDCRVYAKRDWPKDSVQYDERVIERGLFLEKQAQEQVDAATGNQPGRDQQASLFDG